MEKTHAKLGKCVIAEITQKQLEDWSREMKGKSDEPLQVWRGDGIRAAIKLGMILEPKGIDVDNSKPALISWLDQCLAEAIQEATTLDPLS